MNRIAGIVVAAIGFIMAVLSVVNVLPGLTGGGVIMILAGGLVIGLSFVERPDPGETGRMSTAGTLLNIFVSPKEVFQNLRRHPRWLVALLIMSCLSAVYYNLFIYRLTPERVINYTIDKTLEMPMIQNNDKARQQVEESRSKSIEEQKNLVSRAGQAVSSVAGTFFVYCLLAAIFLVFALAMGGQINFFQALSSAVYAGFPVSVIRSVLNTILLFLKDPNDIHPVIGQSTLVQDNLNFLVAPAEHPVVYAALGSLGILWFYWVWMNATGLKNTGEKITGTIAWSASITVYTALLILSAGVALLFPGFFS